MLSFYLAAGALPFVAGLQRFAVAYGYQGLSRAEAWHSARGAFIAVAAIMIALVGWHTLWHQRLG